MPLKKPPAGTSPSGAGSVASVLSDEATKNLHKLIKNSIDEAMKPFTEQLRELTANIGECQKKVKTVEKKMQENNMAVEETKAKVNQLQKSTTDSRKKQEMIEGHLISLQLEKAASVLRFQNVKEDGADLKDRMAQALAPLINSTRDKIKDGITNIFRVETNYTKQHKLSGEVQIRFSQKSLRDEILRAASEKKLTMEGLEIRVLRDIPYLARRRRKRYKELASLLLKNKINYMWLIEGLKYDYKGETFKITSVFKMKEFLRKWGRDLGREEVASEEEEIETATSSEEESEEGEGEAGGGAALAAKIEKLAIRKQPLRDTKK